MIDALIAWEKALDEPVIMGIVIAGRRLADELAAERAAHDAEVGLLSAQLAHCMTQLAVANAQLADSRAGLWSITHDAASIQPDDWVAVSYYPGEHDDCPLLWPHHHEHGSPV